jgi:hypothetical protein
MKRRNTEIPVVCEEIIDSTKYCDTTLRNLVLEDCIVSKCRVYNCTIKRARFWGSEIHQCVFADIGEKKIKEIRIENINTITDCKIYTCDSIRHAVIENSEVHDSTISCGTTCFKNVAIRRSTLFNCRLPEHPMVSRSDLYNCVLSWISDQPSLGGGLANCNIYDSLLENPLVRDSKMRNCKVVGLSAIRPTSDRVHRSLINNLFVECEIQRVAVTQSLFIDSKLMYTSHYASFFTRCSVRRCSAPPVPAKETDASKALRNFPEKQETHRPIEGESEKSLSSLPLEIQLRIVQYTAASLQWKGVSPPLIIALRPHPLFYKTALSAFAEANWYCREATNTYTRRRLRGIRPKRVRPETPKAFHTVRKLEIQ